MQQRLQSGIFWAIVVSETSHVFCCVLPTLFSIISLISGLGMGALMPQAMSNVHELLHHWEVPMIGLSAAVLAMGWVLYYVSRKMDCHSTGCVHVPCEPKKEKAHTVLKIATGLFLFNVLIYTLFHSGLFFHVA